MFCLHNATLMHGVKVPVQAQTELLLRVKRLLSATWKSLILARHGIASLNTNSGCQISARETSYMSVGSQGKVRKRKRKRNISDNSVVSHLFSTQSFGSPRSRITWNRRKS